MVRPTHAPCPPVTVPEPDDVVKVLRTQLREAKACIEALRSSCPECNDPA